MEGAEATSTVTSQDTGAAPVIPTAEGGGSQEVTETGADTHTRTAEGEGSESAETTSQEGAEGATEGSKDRGAHQKTLEERAAEIADRKIQERIAQFEQERQAAQPDYIPLDYDVYDAHIANLVAQERQFADEITLLEHNDPSRVQMVRELRKIQATRQAMENEFVENEKKRALWEVKQGERARYEATVVQINAGLAQASPVVRDALSISPEAWEAGEKWFVTQRQSNPLLDAEYRERCFTEGPIRALKWAATYVKENMGKAAEQSKQKREEGKDKTLSGGGDGATLSFANVNSWGDLMKMHSKQINQFAKEHPKKYETLKKQRFQ